METDIKRELLLGCGFYLNVFGTPEKVKTNDLIPIATRVKYTHQAAVVRWKPDLKLWKLTEPSTTWFPRITVEEEQNDENLSIDSPKDFRSTPQDKINKDVLVWTQTGVAYIFGYVKRGIGKSEKGSYSSNYYGEGEYDPGYFDAKAYVPLYALKSHLQGVDYFFAPIHCVEVI